MAIRAVHVIKTCRWCLPGYVIHAIFFGGASTILCNSSAKPSVWEGLFMHVYYAFLLLSRRSLGSLPALSLVAIRGVGFPAAIHQVIRKAGRGNTSRVAVLLSGRPVNAVGKPTLLRSN